MDEFLKMDIFFVVATVAVAVLAVLSSFILWRLERILRHVEHISEQAAAESDNLREDLAEMRSEVHRGKNRLLALMGFVGKTAKRAEKHHH
jgi:hypothetical protein